MQEVLFSSTMHFESGVHYLELVQSALHRHKYTHFSDHNCDVVQLLFCLHPVNLKKNLIEANNSGLSWPDGYDHLNTKTIWSIFV